VKQSSQHQLRTTSLILEIGGNVMHMLPIVCRQCPPALDHILGSQYSNVIWKSNFRRRRVEGTNALATSPPKGIP